MAYDDSLAQRVRDEVGARPGASEKRMFGGLCFLLNGHMCCGIVDDELMVRVGPEAHAEARAQRHARPVDFTGKPVKGTVYVDAYGVRTAKALREWVARGFDFAGLLLPKR